jgi:hypothetical protein
MQAFMDQYPGWSAAGFVVYFAALWMGVGFLISMVSGWHSLAERYRTDRPFPTHKRWMQSAKMRFSCGYNSILTLASDSEALYLGVLAPFRVGHPRLFVPWGNIRVEEPKRYLFLMSRMLRLGPDAIPLRVREPLAQFLLGPRGDTNTAAPGAVSSTF